MLSAELCGNADPKRVRMSAEHPEDSCSKQKSYMQHRGASGQMSTAEFSHPGKGHFHRGSGNIQLPHCLPPTQRKKGCIKRSEMGINHVYSLRKT